MKKRLTRVMASTVLTGAMVLSMGMSALATVPAGLPEVTEMEFTKKVTTDGKTYAPNTTFKFVVEPGTAVENTDIKGGVADGLSWSEDIAFAPAADDLSAAYSKGGKITVNVKEFDTPGSYRYTIKEIIPADNDKYSGITYDVNAYDIYVTIVNGDDGLYCAGIRASKTDDHENKLDALEFVNNYGAGDDDTTHDVTITKVVTGNQGDKNKLFKFTVKITADQTGEMFSYELSDGTTGTLTDGDEAIEISLKNDESITIMGLTKDDQVTVLEDKEYQSAAEGYKVTTSINDGDKKETEGIENHKVTADGTSVVVENNKNVGAATGVALTFGPYAIMVIVAGAFATMFLRKKKDLEEF